MCRHLISDPILDVDHSSDHFGPVEFGYEIDPRVPTVVVNEGDEISTPAKTYILCQSPYIQMYQKELVSAPIMLVGEWKLVLVLLR